MIDDLRTAFASDERGPVDDGKSCPSSGRIWDAAHARLDPFEARVLADHVAACPACAADWRVALRGESRAVSAAGPHKSRRWVSYVGAAAIVAGLGWALLLGLRLAPQQPPGFRAPPDAIRSLVPENEPLSRQAAVLRWTPLEGDVRYTVVVTLPDLSSLVVGRELDTAEFEIPAEVLRGLPPGQTIVWRVEARFVDGGHRESGAFLGRLDE